ncbi:hypothetical protein GQX74_002841 [Glossina fuscipes]|nr:hypothetical protein GQX74_002841 [Glossina fuscipes]
MQEVLQGQSVQLMKEDELKEIEVVKRSPEILMASLGQERCHLLLPTLQRDEAPPKKYADAFIEREVKISESIETMAPLVQAHIPQPISDLIDWLTVLREEATQELAKRKSEKAYRDRMTNAKKEENKTSPNGREKTRMPTLLLRKKAKTQPMVQHS